VIERITATAIERWRRFGVFPDDPEELASAGRPEDLIELSQLRENARVIAVGSTQGPAAAQNCKPVHIRAGMPLRWDETWYANTDAAIATNTSFLQGMIATDAVMTTIDRGDYNTRVEGWEFRLYRAATGVRPSLEDEAALILIIAEALQIPIHGIYLMYLNKKFVAGEMDWSELFRESNITRRCQARQDRVHGMIVEMQHRRVRERGARERLDAPGDVHDVRTLHKGREIGEKLYRQGVRDIRNIPPGTVKLSEKQQIQIRAVRENGVHIDYRRLQGFVDQIVWPVTFLDFEAYSQSVPPYDGLRPFEHAPVIASVHRQEVPGGPAEAAHFLPVPGEDSRHSLFTWLTDIAGATGTIMVYSQTFESAMVRQLSRVVAMEREGQLLIDRMKDLLVPFAEFFLYHPRQLGKVSLKTVLPVFTEDSYNESPLQDGMEANLLWTIAADAGVSSEEEPRYQGAQAARQVDRVLQDRFGDAWLKATSIEAIATYCSVDTYAMVMLCNRILAFLAEGEDPKKGPAACGA
jgi:hypothetical protein